MRFSCRDGKGGKTTSCPATDGTNSDQQLSRRLKEAIAPRLDQMSTEKAAIASASSTNSGDSGEMEICHLSTPTQPSSVFLTPPSSSRKPPSIKPPPLPQTSTMDLDVLSPALTPDLYRAHPIAQGLYLPDSPPPPTREFLDVLGSLYLCGRGHLSETILFLLEPSDLCR